MTFERASLQDLLVGELRDAGVEVEFGKEFSSVEAEGDVHENALVRFSDGSMVEGDLIVGADGGWSTLRHSMGVQADTGAQDDAFGGVMYSGWVIVYGISEPIEGLPEDETIVLADRALSYGAWPLQNKQVSNKVSMTLAFQLLMRFHTTEVLVPMRSGTLPRTVTFGL
jgi:2-polyprenyl-6-methoxyphenol hydroxylase-like FAD-dependent oxidoreductase